MLIDTRLDILNIYDEIVRLTDKPTTAAATHIYWDHIGGHSYSPGFYARAEELEWLSSKFPLSLKTIREMVINRCDIPNSLDVSDYELFQGKPTRVLADHDIIDTDGREVGILHMPGRAPGCLYFQEEEKEYLFTGDLAYRGILFAYYPSTDPEAYLTLLEEVSTLLVKRVFPAYHSLETQPEILIRIREVLKQLKTEGEPHHGSGTFNYGDWEIWSQEAMEQM